MPAHDVESIYRRYSSTVLRRAMHFLPRAEAEELVHEVFLRLLESPASFRGESSPATWLYTVTTRLCIDRLRSHTLHEALILNHSQTVWAKSDPGTAPEARAFLSSLWRRLDPELTLVGVLYYHDGLTTAQIGKIVGVSDRTVANRLDALTREARKVVGTPEEAP
ncbi:MAG: sigma-70 family RNA polymerase sigma factor [Myxococcota bacterium]